MGQHWDGDHRFIQLASMLSYAAEAAARGEPTSDKKEQIIKFLKRGRWKRADARAMITDACVLLEYGTGPKVYEHGKLIAKALDTSLDAYS